MSGDLTLNLLIAVVTLAMIFLIPAAVFAGVLFKVGWGVCDRDCTCAYFSKGWIKSLNRNFQFFVILFKNYPSSSISAVLSLASILSSASL